MKKFVSVAGYLALIFAFVALFVYVAFPSRTLVAVSLAAFALLNGLYCLVVNFGVIRRSFGGRAGVQGSNTLVVVLIFLGILIFANILSHRNKHRFDFTSGEFFTLSKQTETVLSNLKQDVKLTAFFKTGTQGEKDFKSLVDGYLARTKKIKLSYVDPDSNPSVAKQYGIKAFGEVFLESGDKKIKIKKDNEDGLTNGILKVTRNKAKSVYFLEGHGEKGLDDIAEAGYSIAKKALEKVGRKAERLSLFETANIPGDADLLVISGPVKPIEEKEQNLIESFLEEGGAVLLLIDPKSEFGMEEFLLRWGVAVRDDIIVDPLSKLFGVDRVTPVIKDFARHDITKDFSLPVIFPLLRSVVGLSVEGLKSVDLLKSSPGSWSESDYKKGNYEFDEDEDSKGPIPVSVAVTKTILTLPPSESEAAVEKKNKGALTFKDVKESASKGIRTGKKANLVVIGDSDFASNGFFNSSGNGDFFLNTVSWLIQEENLIFIRVKERKKSPLQLTNTQGRIIFTAIFMVPVLVLIPGIRTWWRRRVL